MRHRIKRRKLGRSSPHRRALLRSMATSFFLSESFYTTIEKAKELRPVVEKLITLARNTDWNARRQARSYLLDRKAELKLFSEIAPRYSNIRGGYTRVVRADRRHGDAAEMAVIELTQRGSAGVATSGEVASS